MARNRAGRWIVLGAAVAAFVVIVANTGWWEAALRFFFPGQSAVIYPRAPLATLVWEHIQLVALSSAITIAVAVPLGTWVTRPAGRAFLPLVADLTSFGQTFPPVAVLALAVPALGFGILPTVIALFMYGLLPVVRNTTSGLGDVPPPMLDAAYGMGMSRSQALWRVELPLAAPAILAGIRISVIINIGTAMIGAVIGAGGLGAPITAGLAQNNVAFIIEGALPAAMMAVIVDRLLGNIEGGMARERAAAT